MIYLEFFFKLPRNIDDHFGRLFDGVGPPLVNTDLCEDGGKSEVCVRVRGQGELEEG